MGITNPLTPNPVFDAMTPPWQIPLLDAWTASVNAAINALYADPVAFAATIGDNTVPTQIIAAGAQATVLFQTPIFQTGGTAYSTSSGVFTAPNSGVFRFESSLDIVTPFGGNAQFSGGFSRNGVSPSSFTDFYAFCNGGLSGTNNSLIATGSVTVNLNAGDTIQVIMTNPGPAAISISSGFGNQNCWFSGARV
jgi:hypothetical protein